MHRKRGLPALVLILGLAAPPAVFPCSSLVLTNKAVSFYATNYDNDFVPGRLFINKRGVRKSGWEAGTTGQAAQWVSRHGSVTISCAGYQLAWGGMNEAGLVFSTMLLGGTRTPPPDERPSLAGAFWWQYMLDTCATIEEVEAAAKSVRISDTVDHYLACDRTGAVAVFECLGDRLVIQTGKAVPVPGWLTLPIKDAVTNGRAGSPDPGILTIPSTGSRGWPRVWPGSKRGARPKPSITPSSFWPASPCQTPAGALSATRATGSSISRPTRTRN